MANKTTTIKASEKTAQVLKIMKELKELRKENTIWKFKNDELTKQLNLCGVMPMLPKITSKEFSDYIKNNGYERIDDELLQKGKNYLV